MSYRYFAYGSILDADHFADWAKEHGYEGRTLEEGRPAVLDDWELTLSVPSRYWMGAVGTIEPRPGSSVYGVLYVLDDDWADMIRHKEGVASGLYREAECEVRLWMGGGDESTIQLLSASAFRAAEGKSSASPTAVSQRWLDIVLRGGAAHGLPDLWLAELKRKARR
jgi:hypothetical protein